MSMPDISTN